MKLTTDERIAVLWLVQLKPVPVGGGTVSPATQFSALRSIRDFASGAVYRESLSAIANRIITQKADYCLAVKGNQPTLHEGIKAFFVKHLEDNFAVIPRCADLRATKKGTAAKTIARISFAKPPRTCLMDCVGADSKRLACRSTTRLAEAATASRFATTS